MATIRYTFSKDYNFQSSYHLLYCSYSKYEKDWSSYPHTHYFAEFFYVVDGSGSFQIAGESFPLSSHDFLIVNPNIVHTEISSHTSPLEYIVLGIDGLSFLTDNNKEYLYFHDLSIKKNLDFYFRSILTELEEQQKDYQNACQNLLELLIIQLVRCTNSPIELLPAQKKATRECSRAKRYIDSNFRENISLDKLAKIASLSKYYFSHTFSDIYGISPMNYLMQKRISTSRELLTSTDMSLSEIAQQCGFSSLSYFSQCFRKSCGSTPGAYRRQFLKS